MALTRKLLKGLALNDETIDTIIEAHAETVDALKQRIADYEAKSGETESITKERDDWKKKYEALEKTSGDASKIKAEFDDYKKQVETKEANAKKTAALETVLKEIGITSESARKLFMRNYDLTGINLDESGAIANRVDIETTIKTEYGDLISTQQNKGADPTNPPGGSRTTDKDAFEKMSLGEKMKFANENPEKYREFTK